MYRTSTTLILIEDAYRRERAEQALREQRRWRESRARRVGSEPRERHRSWRRGLRLRLALPR